MNDYLTWHEYSRGCLSVLVYIGLIIIFTHMPYIRAYLDEREDRKIRRMIEKINGK